MSVVEREREVVAPKVTDADVLERAADLCEELTWAQHVYYRGAKGESCEPGAAHMFCMMGAVRRAGADFGLGTDDSDEALPWLVGVVGGSMTIWNDTPGRTKAEVVTALRTAAKKARES